MWTLLLGGSLYQMFQKHVSKNAKVIDQMEEYWSEGGVFKSRRGHQCGMLIYEETTTFITYV
jgi:hypothetical protein